MYPARSGRRRRGRSTIAGATAATVATLTLRRARCGAVPAPGFALSPRRRRASWVVAVFDPDVVGDRDDRQDNCAAREQEVELGKDGPGMRNNGCTPWFSSCECRVEVHPGRERSVRRIRGPTSGVNPSLPTTCLRYGSWKGHGGREQRLRPGWSRRACGGCSTRGRWPSSDS